MDLGTDIGLELFGLPLTGLVFLKLCISIFSLLKTLAAVQGIIPDIPLFCYKMPLAWKIVQGRSSILNWRQFTALIPSQLYIIVLLRKNNSPLLPFFCLQFNDSLVFDADNHPTSNAVEQLP